MGQYYILVNVDKKEYCDAWELGGVAKMAEWCTSPQSFVMPYLLGLCNGHGGGDIPPENRKYLGHWAGDRVVLVGDYWGDGDDDKIFPHLYKEVREHDLELYESYVREKETAVKSGFPHYMGDNKYTYFIPKEKETLKKWKAHLRMLRALKKKHPEKIWRNISKEVKAEFEGFFGRDSLSWNTRINPLAAPDITLSVSPSGQGSMSTDKDAVKDHKDDQDFRSDNK